MSTGILPVRALPTAEVDIDGTTVKVRGLSRGEAMKVGTTYSADTAGAGEAFIVSCGTGVSVEEATEWLNSVDVPTSNIVLQKIIELSGMKSSADPKP